MTTASYDTPKVEASESARIVESYIVNAGYVPSLRGAEELPSLIAEGEKRPAHKGVRRGHQHIIHGALLYGLTFIPRSTPS